MRMKVFIIVLMIGLRPVLAETPHADDLIIRHYAEHMSVSDSMLHITELYTAIHEWMGTPYRYGRSDKKGTDCSGFVRNVFLPLCGKELPRSAADMSKVIQSKPIAELQEGDLVFFNYRGRTNSHVGIYLQNGWFVHASTVHGVTLNNLHSSYYTQRFSKGGPLKQGELKKLVQKPEKECEELPVLNLLTPIRIKNINFLHFLPTVITSIEP